MAVPTIFFPRTLFPPRVVTPDIMAVTAGGGRSITSFEQVPAVDAGFWQIVMTEIPFASPIQKRIWRAMAAKLRGRANTCAVPIYATDTTPWPLDNVGRPITTEDVVPHSDGSYFSDGVTFRKKVIFGTFSDNFSAGATQIMLTIANGTASPLQAGHMFSAANRLYGIKTIIESHQQGGGFDNTVYTVIILPPLREDVLSNQTAEFDDPRCICRLATDGEMRSGIDDYAGTTLAKVTFVEAINP